MIDDPVLNLVVTQLKKEEGYERFPYKDTVGKLTVGYGRNLDDVGIRPQEAEMLLSNDVSLAYSEALQAMPWMRQLSILRQAVLVDMAFNMGIHGLLAFQKMLAAAEAGNFEEAAAEMLASKWAQQVGARANHLSEQMRVSV